MTKDDALKLALEALMEHGTAYLGHSKEYQQAIAKGKEALAQPEQPEQEPVLQNIEQYRMQMAGICTASIGYWKEGDDIHPDYDTIALRDVAMLYAKYDALYKAQPEQEPFGYFKAEPFGWTDCAEADEGAIALYERPAPEQEREACAELAGEFARKWWSIHCASNKHLETTRKAHDDFCALQAMIRARGETSPPEQEPVATKTEKGITLHIGWDDLPADTKLYTSPPARKDWVGLNAYDMDYIQSYAMDSADAMMLTEAKLKEKNHD